MKRKLLGGLLLFAVLFAGCGQQPDQETQLRQAYQQAAKLCSDSYQKAERSESPYTAQEVWLTEAGQAELEACLRAADLIVAEEGQEGVNVLSAGGEAFADFYEYAQRAEGGAVTVYTIERRGQLHARTYRLEGGEKLRTEAVFSWDERGKPQMEACHTLPVEWWTVTEKGNFICAYDKGELASYEVLRLQPPEEQLAALSEQYIASLGYQGNNLFTSDWSEENWQDLACNDLLEYLYRMQMNADFYGGQYAFAEEKGWRIVPQALFEQVLGQYLTITPEALREQAHYVEAEAGYPWVELSCVTWDYQPVMVPDVTAFQSNDDGTLTLTVEVISAEEGTDQLFTHELTVRPLAGGRFQYVSNRVVSGEAGRYVSRLELAENYVSNIF